MPIPPLDNDGLLPVGVHLCTIEEVAATFGRFERSDRRIQLVGRLKRYFAELQSVDLVKFLILDGSFVTSREEPGDIDILLALHSDADLSKDLPPYVLNAISKKSVSKRFGFDLLPASEGSDEYQKYLEFFSQVKGQSGRRKRLLKVTV